MPRSSDRSSRRNQSRGDKRSRSRGHSDRHDSTTSGRSRRSRSIRRKDRATRRHRRVRTPSYSRSGRRSRSFELQNAPQNETLDRILVRLGAIEDRVRSTPSVDALSRPETDRPSGSAFPHSIQVPVSDQSTPLPKSTNATTDTNTIISSEVKDETDKVVMVLSKLINSKSDRFYVSPFDPSVQNFDSWCEEVDRARTLNNWDNRECLGRVGSCLRGDAKTWLSEWTTNDRTWSNFKIEFRSLCPQKVDSAAILFDVMNKNSNDFSTYADYARKSLLRLNIVNGLSDELKAAIVVRGIIDPHVKAAATNAKLLPHDIVQFLSNFVKPKPTPRNTHNANPQKRHHPNDNTVVCRNCGRTGHKQWACTKRAKQESPTTSRKENSATKPVPTESTHKNKSTKVCTFCKRSGHLVDDCFQKQRSDTKGKSVNFCSESSPNAKT